MTDIAIKATGLGKKYKLGAMGSQHDSVRDMFTAAFRRKAGGEASGEFWALRNASFEIKRGENVGIIGLNGAGKSTLLKVLSQIVTPTEGTAEITGRLGALLEVGTGFHQELTGRENVYLYGSILGMSRDEIASKFDQIIAFSEIEKFIDTPVKRYSSGMYVRLAFSVAAHLDPDILLLDEVLAVGDFSFQRKCIDLAKSLERRGSTILFVSHNMFSIKTMCPRVIYLRKGEVVFDGPTDEGLRLYEENTRLEALPWFRSTEKPPVSITNVELLTEDGQPRSMFDFGERLRMRISYKTTRPIEAPHFVCTIKRSDELLCCNYSSWGDGAQIGRIDGEGVIDVLAPALSLVSDRYAVDILVRENNTGAIVAAQSGPTFHLRHEVFDPSDFGVFHQTAHWSHDNAV
ncbi:MAG: ABC transporter ATP-binding protein [Hyphomonadaceae bacterium]|nr:ABC transporter ATP-binding protein [Hyphomonadaceae bacterium]